MWKNVKVNIQNIKFENGRSVLINCPHKSNYDGFSFWHPAKLVRMGSHSYEKTLGYTDEFKFKLIKYGKGKYNKFDIIEEKEISVKEFEEMFEVNSNEESYIKVEEPTKIEEKVEVEKCLINN